VNLVTREDKVHQILFTINYSYEFENVPNFHDLRVIGNVMKDYQKCLDCKECPYQQKY
jgi:hypothetical protein